MIYSIYQRYFSDSAGSLAFDSTLAGNLSFVQVFVDKRLNNLLNLVNLRLNLENSEQFAYIFSKIIEFSGVRREFPADQLRRPHRLAYKRNSQDSQRPERDNHGFVRTFQRN